jgi:hypothetical protein
MTPHNRYESPAAEVVVVQTEDVICQSREVTIDGNERQDYGDPETMEL